MFKICNKLFNEEKTNAQKYRLTKTHDSCMAQVLIIGQAITASY